MEKTGKKHRMMPVLIGAACGVLNGLFGAGGGIAAVPLLKKAGLEQKRANATALAVILPISIVSAVLYLANGSVQLMDALPYLPGGILGACVGAMVMKRLSNLFLRRAFGVFMVYAAVRLLLR